MSDLELAIGEKVKVYEKGVKGSTGTAERKSGYFLKCTGTVVDLQPAYILIDTGNYKSRYDIIEFRTRRYRLIKTCGVEVRFDPLPDQAAIERQIRKKAHEEYINSPAGRGYKTALENQKKDMSITWETISALLAEGMSPGEIADELGSTIWIIKGMITKMEKMKEREEAKMAKQGQKITRDELLQYVRENGMDKRAICELSKKVGLTTGTLNFYIYDWGIMRQLKNEQAEQDMKEATEAMSAELEPKQKETEEAAPAEKPISEIEDEEQLARDREAVREATYKRSDKMIEETQIEAQEITGQMPEERFNISETYVCAYKGCTSLISSGTFCEKHAFVSGLPQVILSRAEIAPMQRRILRPVNMRGEATGNNYIFTEEGFRIDGETQYRFDDIDGLIEELMAIKNMRSA